MKVEMLSKLEKLQAKLDVEQEAAAKYFERTGKDYYKLRPTQQRKVIENWKEDHE